MAEQPILIAHVIHHLMIGGLENGLVNLINHIPSEKYRHAIICIEDYSDFHQRIQRSDVQIFAMHRSKGNNLSLLWKLFRLFRKIKPTIVHSRNTSALDSLLPAVLAGVPYRIHGEHGWDVDDLTGRNTKKQWLRRFYKPMIQQYIALSKHTEKYLYERIHVPTNRLVQIYNGVDTERFFPAQVRRTLPAKHEFADSGQLVIGTVGRLQPVKDQKTLVNAFVCLLQQRPDLRDRIRLVLVGDGACLLDLKNAIEQANVTELVWLAGAREDIPDLLRCFDIFVLPSLAEGISNTILEAMATGLPIVATDVGGNSELIDADKTGKLVHTKHSAMMAEAITVYIDDPELRHAHGIAARQRVMERFTLDKMVSDYVGQYDQMHKNIMP